MWSIIKYNRELEHGTENIVHPILNDEQDKYVETIHLVLDGEDYKQWKSSGNDTYLLNWVCNKLNLTIQQ